MVYANINEGIISVRKNVDITEQFVGFYETKEGREKTKIHRLLYTLL